MQTRVYRRFNTYGIYAISVVVTSSVLYSLALLA